MSIEITGLKKVYGTQVAVNNISFSVDKGAVVGFLGPNGAGKSTTMKMITGYLAPDGGAVKVCGMDVAAQPLEVKQKIGYLPEANPLYYDMYVREYLDFIAGVHGLQNKNTAIESAIELVGLSRESKKKTGQLSKGYKQRVGLAAALLHNPEVMILDEPTSGLDPNQIVEIREVIRNLGKEKTVLFSSHILQEVEAICDRVVIINRGNIVANDSLGNLLGGRQQNSLRLELKETVEPGLFGDIQNITRINATTWQLDTDNPDALRRTLMQLALDKNLSILSLTANTQNSLEDIFRSLTNVSSSNNATM
jgi:ABC-2 type transport system ATP-binding protein